MVEILLEVEETTTETFTFELKNTEFINKEISFFIDNLRKVRNETF
jgi:hypothetical protein